MMSDFNLFDYNQFDHVFPSSVGFPYDRKTIQETETYRKSFGGALFIDRVLSALGLSKGMIPLFPVFA